MAIKKGNHIDLKLLFAKIIMKHRSYTQNYLKLYNIMVEKHSIVQLLKYYSFPWYNYVY